VDHYICRQTGPLYNHFHAQLFAVEQFFCVPEPLRVAGFCPCAFLLLCSEDPGSILIRIMGSLCSHIIYPHTCLQRDSSASLIQGEQTFKPCIRMYSPFLVLDSICNIMLPSLTVWSLVSTHPVYVTFCSELYPVSYSL